jgi:hypothetical protein
VTCKAPGGQGGPGGAGGFGQSHTFRGKDKFDCLEGAVGGVGTAGHDGACDLNLNMSVQN